MLPIFETLTGPVLVVRSTCYTIVTQLRKMRTGLKLVYRELTSGQVEDVCDVCYVQLADL